MHTQPNDMDRSAVHPLCVLLDHKEGTSGLRDKVRKALRDVGSLLDKVDDRASVLFLHWSACIETHVERFLNGRADRIVILISTTGDPNPEERDDLHARFEGRVRALINGVYAIDSDLSKQLIRKLLSEHRK